MPKEKTIVEQITKALRAKGVYVVKFHGSPYMPPGLPDLWCILAGRLVCLEVKQPGEQPTKRQVFEMGRLRAVGVTVAVVTSSEEAMDVVLGISATRTGGAGNVRRKPAAKECGGRSASATRDDRA